VKNQAIASLIVNAVSILACCFTGLTLFSGIAGVVLSSMALNRLKTDLPGAKNLVKWSWIALAIGVGAGIVLGVVSSIVNFAPWRGGF
jgi:hypothetical protein